MRSPDDSWVAFVQEEVRGDGGYVTTVDDIVRLVRRGVRPTRENDIFAIEMHGHAEYRPVLRWLSSKKSQITVPNTSIVNFHKRNYQGIEIAVRFDPDDPAGRQQFLKLRGLDPD